MWAGLSTIVCARGRHRWSGLVVPAFACWLLAGAAPVSGQTAIGRQDLSFGMVMPGVPSTVYVNDAARRAEWFILGSGQVTVSFVLPSVLNGPSGAVLPVNFAYGDLGFIQGFGGGAMQLRDPATPFTLDLGRWFGFYRLFLGGTALPATTQAAGTYTATVTVILAQP